MSRDMVENPKVVVVEDEVQTANSEFQLGKGKNPMCLEKLKGRSKLRRSTREN